MRSPVGALIWEQWRQVWWVAPLGIVLTCSFSLALHQDPDIGWYSDLWWVGSTASILGSLALAGGLLLFMHSTPTDVRAGIPARHRTLPVRTTTLVLSQFVFRLGYVVGLTAVLTALAWLIDVRYAPAVVPSVVAAACVMSLAMAAMWTIGKRSIGLAALCVIGTTILSNIAFAWAQHEVPLAAPAIPAGILLVSSIVAVRGATHVGAGAGRLARLKAVATIAPQIATGRTAVQAHAWFETRRRSQVVWVLAALIFCLLFGILVMPLWSDVTYLRQWGNKSSILHFFARRCLTWAQVLIYVPPIVAFASSICFVMLDIRDATLRMANFLFTRPIRTRDVVRARFRFGTRTALQLCTPLCVLGCTLAAVGCALIPDGYSNLPSFFRSHEFPLAWFLSFAATTLLFWSAFPALATILWLLFAAMSDLVDHHGELSFGAVPVAILIVAIVRAVHAYRNGTWPRRFVLLAFGMALLFWLGTLYLESRGPMGRDDEILFAASTIGALLLYVPFSQPLWIDFLRHGGATRSAKRPMMEV